MSNLFHVTAPCIIRHPDGSRQVMAELFPHPDGLLYFDLYWHESDPDEAFHIVKGTVTGDGPWKVGESVVTVLGCEGTDPELSAAWSDWQAIIQSPLHDYPEAELIAAIARKLGASE